MGIMSDEPTVKEHCEAWGREHGIIVTADQYVEQLIAENDKLKEERNSLRHAVGMLNSMVLCGKKHSDTPRQIVKDAMSGKRTKGAEE